MHFILLFILDISMFHVVDVQTVVNKIFYSAKEIEKTVPYENNQLQSGPAYVDQSSYGVVDTSQRYFPVLKSCS